MVINVSSMNLSFVDQALLDKRGCRGSGGGVDTI